MEANMADDIAKAAHALATASTPAEVARAKIDQAAANATAQLQQMTRDYHASAGYRAEQLRGKLEALDADGHFLDQELVNPGARSHRASLRAQLATAEREAMTEVQHAFSDAKRVDNAMAGITDHVGIETTVGQPDNPQLPARDFTAAVQDDLALGVRADVVREFHATGKSGLKFGHVDGQYWLDRLAEDTEMQTRLANGDSVMKQRFRLACMLVSGRCGDATPEEEAAYRSRLAASPHQGR
jgi:hypothetical protein